MAARTSGSSRLTAASVVGPDHLYSPGFVDVAGGVITDVGPLGTGRAPKHDVLVPGFVDLQVNGIGAVDVAHADGDDWKTLGWSLLEQGVTSWCPTLVTSPDEEIRVACARIAAARQTCGNDLPRIAGVHLEGPFITVLGAHREQYARASVPARWVGDLHPLVKVVTLAPEIEGAMSAIGAMARAGIVASVGHTSCSSEQAHEAADLGARLVTHLGNANGPFHQRSPGLLGAALSDPRLSVSVIADLEHVHADLLGLTFKAKRPGRTVLVTDSVATAAGTVGPVNLAGGGAGRAARLHDGTLAGSSLTMDRAVRNAVQAARVSLEEAVNAASRTPASVLGLGDCGEIAPGKRADLVELSTAPGDGRGGVGRVLRVWLAGEPVYLAGP